MSRHRISFKRTNAVLGLGGTVLLGCLGNPTLALAEDDTPAATLVMPKFKKTPPEVKQTEVPILPNSLQFSPEPKTLPLTIPPSLVEPTPTTPAPTPTPPASEESKPKTVTGQNIYPAAVPTGTPRVSENATGNENRMGVGGHTQTRWQVYEDRLNGIGNRDKPTMPAKEIAVVRDPDKVIMPLPPSDNRFVGMPAPTPLPVVKTESSISAVPTGYLPGTLVPLAGSIATVTTKPLDRTSKPIASETPAPNIIIVTVAPPTIPATRPAELNLPAPAPVEAKKSAPPQADKDPVAWVAKVPSPQTAPDLSKRNPAATTEPTMPSPANAVPNVRAQSFFQNNSASSHWQTDNVAASERTGIVQPPAKVVAQAPPPAPVRLAPSTQNNPQMAATTPVAAPARTEQKVVPASLVTTQTAAAPIFSSPYTLLSWQWTEKIRNVAGPSALNLVGLINAKGAVKVQFDCPDPATAKAIADRIAAIPEFRKLEIDFEINSK